jgi:hypothetical protein
MSAKSSRYVAQAMVVSTRNGCIPQYPRAQRYPAIGPDIPDIRYGRERRYFMTMVKAYEAYIARRHISRFHASGFLSFALTTSIGEPC